jgi:hypothetical protein
MRHLIATAPFMEEVNSMRKAINENLISLFEEHNVNIIDCFPIGDTPAVIDCSIDSDTFTLDTIVLHKNSNGNHYIEFAGSNSYTNDYFYIDDIGIERLIEIYDWVKANEEELFEDVE